MSTTKTNTGKIARGTGFKATDGVTNEVNKKQQAKNLAAATKLQNKKQDALIAKLPKN